MCNVNPAEFAGLIFVSVGDRFYPPSFLNRNLQFLG